MFRHLWRAYYADDLEQFRQLLDNARSHHKGRASSGKTQNGSQRNTSGLRGGAISSFGTSPYSTSKGRAPSSSKRGSSAAADTPHPPLSRADVNHVRYDGCTILHVAASSTAASANDFARVLLEHPWIDLYIQDRENGWTALHRALYAGNITIAYEIIKRDVHRDVVDTQRAGELFKIKDHEKNTPFDLYAFTVQPGRQSAYKERILPDPSLLAKVGVLGRDRQAAHKPWFLETSEFVDIGTLELASDIPRDDEVYTFGSNKNITLGFGDSDDRQYPARLSLNRDPSLFQGIDKSTTGLPIVAKDDQVGIDDIQLSRYHSAIITSDARSNLYLCGHGTGGRLGTGNEKSQLTFVRIDGGALKYIKVARVALGENHTLAVSSNGDLFSWGLDTFGQLGHQLPNNPPVSSVDASSPPAQLQPKRLVGSLKKERISSVAASRIHSVACTKQSIYAWGKNEGQFGVSRSDIPDPIIGPKEVFKAEPNCEIDSVCATDRATCVLLSTGELLLFTHYKTLRVDLGPDSLIIDNSSPRRRSSRSHGTLTPIQPKISAGGDILSVLTSNGEVYNLTIRGTPAFEPSDANFGKALYKVQRIWAPGKFHMEAKDIGTDEDGGIILVTEAGSVWKRIRRRLVKYAGSLDPKHFKFVRVPGVNRIQAVRASGHGAYAVTRAAELSTKEVPGDEENLRPLILKLSPLNSLYKTGSLAEGTSTKPYIEASNREELQRDVTSILDPTLKDNNSGYSLIVRAESSAVQFPVHRFIMASQNAAIAKALSNFDHFGHYHLPGVMRILVDDQKRTQIVFEKLSFLTLFTFFDTMYDPPGEHSILTHKPWTRTPAVEAELKQLDKDLEAVEKFERGASDHYHCYDFQTFRRNMEVAVRTPNFFDDGDVIVELADDEIRVHGPIMRVRSPFFDTMLSGHWRTRSEPQDVSPKGNERAVRVDLTQFELSVFQPVLEFAYSGREAFLRGMSFDNIDALLDFTLNVLQIADFLLMDSLSEICQAVIGLYVNDRNVCSLLNETIELKMKTFKRPALEYICYNLETLIENNLIGDLDESVFGDVNETVRDIQRIRRNEALNGRTSAIDKFWTSHPELVENEAEEKQEVLVDLTTAIRLGDKRARFANSKIATAESGSPKITTSPAMLPKTRRKPNKGVTSESTQQNPRQALKARESSHDLMFDMDDDNEGEMATRRRSKSIQTPETSSAREAPAISDSLGHSLGRESLPATTELDAISPGDDLPAAMPHFETHDTPSSDQPVDIPWNTKLPSRKLGMKEIMEQAASSRTSGISLGISDQARDDRRATSGPSQQQATQKERTRLSQKERKKIQQQQQQPPPRPTTPPKKEERPSLPATTPKQSSPWQSFNAGPKAPLKEILTQPEVRSETSTAPRPSQPTDESAIRSPSPSRKPSAGLPTPQRAHSHHQRSPASPTHKPNPSSPVITAKSFSEPPKPPPPAQSAPTIRSVRHIPRPELPPDTDPSNRSLDDIFSQQQAEKDFKYTMTKASLKDIQTEQEFNEWWEKEAELYAAQQQREEEGPAKRGGHRGGRGGGKRGRNGERGRGKGKPERGGRGARSTSGHA